MAVIEIDSESDERLDAYRSLRDQATGPGDHFIVEGRHLVQRLITSGIEIDSVLLSANRLEKAKGFLPPGLQVYVLDEKKIRNLVGFNFHRGILASAKRPREPEFSELLHREDFPAMSVACPEITDSENLGSIMRTAWCLGLGALMLGERCTDPYSRRSVRVSMGAAFSMPVYRSGSIVDDLRELRDHRGTQLVAAVADSSAIRLRDLKPAGQWCVVLGNEELGLQDEILDVCQSHVFIPMAAGADSLNVSVASGIILHHMVGGR